MTSAPGPDSEPATAPYGRKATDEPTGRAPLVLVQQGISAELVALGAQGLILLRGLVGVVGHRRTTDDAHTLDHIGVDAHRIVEACRLGGITLHAFDDVQRTAFGQQPLRRVRRNLGVMGERIGQFLVPLGLFFPTFMKAAGDLGISQPCLTGFGQHLSRQPGIHAAVIEFLAFTGEEADRRVRLCVDRVQAGRHLVVDGVTCASRDIAAVALAIKRSGKPTIDAVFAFQLVRSHRAHFDVITLRLKILDQLRCPLSIAQRGIENDVFLTGDGCIAQFVGPLAGVGVGAARPCVGVGGLELFDAGMVVAQFVRVDFDDIPDKLFLGSPSQTTLTSSWLPSQNDGLWFFVRQRLIQAAVWNNSLG